MKERLISLLVIVLIGGLGAYFLASTYLEELDATRLLDQPMKW